MSKNRTLGIISVALALIVLFFSFQLKPVMQLAKGDPGPQLFPIVAAAFLGIFGLILAFDKGQQPKKNFLEKKEWKRTALLYALFVAYAVAINLIGFLFSSIIMLFVCCTLFAGKKKIPVYIRILYAVLLGFAVWFLLQEVFKVTLPAGILFG